eukprot:CAMPEP_0118698890 /NCGR_PEP_ID=MMETSP0800-20121206/15507_1 /TAXON_ID=210618 ORGANISM="Striatella unipunctata, Strain CCMP2910" /NCGR_SAMPLE_ID=MMETSP0800 /ASSEMBLY_ACC=CAM_ASM_000638 /LENGTH=589 /DNA_ID=CAMNT_0006598871 /DNA_START=51 /DNA_END=1820 /DNA_ORIENTATION=+
MGRRSQRSSLAMVGLLLLCGLIEPISGLESSPRLRTREGAFLQQIQRRPKRVQLPDFFLNVCPTLEVLTLEQAKDVRDIAESVIETALREFVGWDGDIQFEYFRFAAVLAIDASIMNSMSCSSIEINGAVASFNVPNDNDQLPTREKMQGLAYDALYPMDGTLGFLDALRAHGSFDFVSSVQHNPITKEPTMPPTSIPTKTPTLAPTFSEILNDSIITEKFNNGGQDSFTIIPLLMAAGAGIILTSVLSFFVVNYRRRRAYWREEVVHKYNADETNMNQARQKYLHSQDSLQPGQSDNNSDAGSSRLGRLLAATRVQNSHRSESNRDGSESPNSKTNSDWSVDTESVDTHGEHTSRTPGSVGNESFEDQRVGVVVRKEMITASPVVTVRHTLGGLPGVEMIERLWKKQKQTDTVLKPTELSSEILEKATMESNGPSDMASVELAPDEAWDPDDNVAEDMDIEPFSDGTVVKTQESDGTPLMVEEGKKESLAAYELDFLDIPSPQTVQRQREVQALSRSTSVGSSRVEASPKATHIKKTVPDSPGHTLTLPDTPPAPPKSSPRTPVKSLSSPSEIHRKRNNSSPTPPTIV